MKIEKNHFTFGYDGKKCFVHARLCPLNEQKYIMTTQYLTVAGSDAFGGLYSLKSDDGGKTWTLPEPEPSLAPQVRQDHITAFCDGNHIFHKKTGKALLIGATVDYSTENPLFPAKKYHPYTFYAVYDESIGHYSERKLLELPCEAEFGFGSRAGSVQIVQEDNGDLLIPVYMQKEEESRRYVSRVFRCSFDGENLIYRSCSNTVEYPEERGAYEPSLCKCKGKYYLTVRNDNCGLWSVSQDGKHFSAPKIWQWDTEYPLPTYNTQSHWLVLGEKLYLVYTRKCGSNDHVFRHRAPLFIAEVQTEEDRLCVLRQTEQIVVPERGARLGNFGVISITPDRAVVTVNEWMQPVGCEKYGSDNSFWVTTVSKE